MAKDTHFLAIDLGEVLLSVDHWKTYRHLAEICGLSPDEVQRRLDDQPIIHSLDRGEMTPEQFAVAVSDALACKITVGTLRTCWTGILGVKHDVAAWLETVIPQVTCILVSNINWWHWQEAQELLPLLARFDAHVLSYVEGVRKPEAEYYQRVRNRWPIARTLFVDDRLENCTAAREHGFTAWQFKDLPPLTAFVETWLKD
jgi:FMN phosphatase YigB (HAD superfamily)